MFDVIWQGAVMVGLVAIFALMLAAVWVHLIATQGDNDGQP